MPQGRVAMSAGHALHGRIDIKADRIWANFHAMHNKLETRHSLIVLIIHCLYLYLLFTINYLIYHALYLFVYLSLSIKLSIYLSVCLSVYFLIYLIYIGSCVLDLLLPCFAKIRSADPAPSLPVGGRGLLEG
jgi:hypothetical protein